MSSLWQCVSIEIGLGGYIISNLFSELTIAPGYNIAEIQHSLSTRPGLRSLKIFVDVERSGIVPGLLPAVFDCRTLHQDLEQLAIVNLEGRAPYSLKDLYALQNFRRLRCISIDGLMERCEALSLAKFVESVEYWCPQTLEVISCSWGGGEVKSTHVLEQLPWITVFSAERDVESLGCLYHPSIEYISFDLLTAQGTIRQWSDGQWEALAERCPNLKCVAWMDDLFSYSKLPAKQFQRFDGGVKIVDAMVEVRVFSEAPALSRQWLKLMPLWWRFSICFRFYCRSFLPAVDRSFLLSIYFGLYGIN